MTPRASFSGRPPRGIHARRHGRDDDGGLPWPREMHVRSRGAVAGRPSTSCVAGSSSPLWSTPPAFRPATSCSTSAPAEASSRPSWPRAVPRSSPSNLIPSSPPTCALASRARGAWRSCRTMRAGCGRPACRSASLPTCPSTEATRSCGGCSTTGASRSPAPSSSYRVFLERCFAGRLRDVAPRPHYQATGRRPRFRPGRHGARPRCDAAGKRLSRRPRHPLGSRPSSDHL